MCEMYASRERLAAVSKERDEWKSRHDILEACYVDACREATDIIRERDKLRTELNRLTNPGPEEAPTRSDILDLAKRCVCGDREQDYGSPEQNFERIAEMWEVYMVGKCTDADVCILPEDVAAMLALLKIARIASGHAKADNWVDLAGYAACGGEIEGRK